MSRSRYIIISLSLLVPITGIMAVGIGAIDIPASAILKTILEKLHIGTNENVTSTLSTIVWNIRLPRVIMGLLVGGSLALCGVAMQGLFRNPLADPSIIGVTTGSALTTAIAIVMLSPFLNEWQEIAGIGPLAIASFVGAVFSAYLVFALAKDHNTIKVETMLLSGIAINAMAGAGIGLLIYLADDAELRTITFWTLGSLGGANWEQVIWMAIALFIAVMLIMPMSKSFNALSLGEREAAHLGIDIENLKLRIILGCGLIIGMAVAFTGVIGFIGLVVPHILRLVGASRHQFLIPACILGGALLLTLADVASRTVVAPAELPIGIITALLGSPLFLYLLLQQKKSKL